VVAGLVARLAACRGRCRTIVVGLVCRAVGVGVGPRRGVCGVAGVAGPSGSTATDPVKCLRPSRRHNSRQVEEDI